jgi:cell wall-associated NlpC family hydrolase
MRQLAAALFSCALLSAALLAGPAPEAHAQGYDVSGQAVVADARSSYIGTPYGAYGFDCSGFTSAVFADLGVYLPDSTGPSTPTGRPRTPRRATWCFSTSTVTASRTWG